MKTRTTTSSTAALLAMLAASIMSAPGQAPVYTLNHSFTDTTLSGLAFAQNGATGGYSTANGGSVTNSLVFDPGGFVTYGYTATNPTATNGNIGQYFTTGHSFTLPALTTSVVSISASISYQEATAGTDPNVRMAWSRNGVWTVGALPYIVNSAAYTAAWQNSATTTDSAMTANAGDVIEFGLYFVNTGTGNITTARDASFDNLTYSLVYNIPEPSTSLLGAGGLLGLLVRRRR